MLSSGVLSYGTLGSSLLSSDKPKPSCCSNVLTYGTLGYSILNIGKLLLAAPNELGKLGSYAGSGLHASSKRVLDLACMPQASGWIWAACLKHLAGFGLHASSIWLDLANMPQAKGSRDLTFSTGLCYLKQRP